MLAKNIIDGKETYVQNGQERKRFDPATGAEFSSYYDSTKDEIKAAVDSAESALNEGKWSSNANLRSSVLLKIAKLMTDNLDHLAKIQSQETGKILKNSYIELRTAIDLFNFYGGLTRSIYGKSSLSEPGKLSITIREPVGIVTIIVPWNAPVVLLARSLAPAMAAGNPIVIKPSSLAPYSVYEFIRIINDNCPEMPPGTLNLLQGSGSTVGKELTVNKKVSMISFTGSTGTGKQIMRDASEDLKRVTLELGGKSPNVVFADANLDNALTGAIAGSMFGSAGQICFAGTRLLVQESAHDKMIKRVKETLPKLKVSGPLDPDAAVGPVISGEQETRVLEYIEHGKNSGDLVYGGTVLRDGELSKGHFIMPTVFDNVDPDSKIAQEEIFGPVLSVIPFKDVTEAVELANRTNFGLASAVWTSDLNTALKAATGIKAGTVWVNTFGKLLSETESGGYKQSGVGRSRGMAGLESYTELKNIIIDLPS